MKTKRYFTYLYLIILLMAGVLPAVAKEKATEVAPEFRAAWVHRWEWPHFDPETCKQKIRTIFDDLQRANFNAVVFQIRGQADVFYPSPYDPWSPLIGAKDPGWDPLAFAIEEAHKRGLEFHAYVNPMPLWHTGITPESHIPEGSDYEPSRLPAHTSPEHLYYRHGPDAEVSWVCHDATGNPMQVRDNDYYYMAASIPGVQAYIRTVFLDLVKRYDIDGIHYDRIRTPGSGYSHDPISVRRFKGAGNPNGLSWEDWQREQLNKLVGDLYAEIAEVKPWIRVSCAAWGLYNRYEIPGYERFSSGYHDYFQDSVRWIQDNSMDTLMPMIYWDIPDPTPNFDEVLQYFTTKVPADRVFGGMTVHRGGVEKGGTFDEIQASREIGTEGTVIFSYNSLNRDKENWEKFWKKVYPTPAPIPSMPWKENPQTGILSGIVLDQEGNPIEDAILEIEGHPQKWTSGEDGFFAFTGLEPGPKTLRVTHEKTSLFSPIDIEAGEVVSIRCLPVETGSESLQFRMISPRRIKTSTSREYVNVAVHTSPENKAMINGEEVHVYKTGIFIADKIPLNPGINKIEIAIETPAGIRIQRIRWVEKTQPEPLAILPALPLQIEPKSVEPRFDYLVQPGDRIPVGFKGSPGHQANFRIGKRGPWQPMTELPPEEQEGIKGLYSGEYIVQPEDEFKNALIDFRLLRNREVEGATRSPSRIATVSKAMISTLDPATPVIAEVSEEFADLNVGLGQVRLGGPILSTVPKETRLELSGKIGRNWRVRLSDTTQAWIGEDSIRLLPPGTPSARGFITYFSVDEDDRYDLIKIPFPQKVPFRIEPIDEPNSLLIDLYGITSNTTWITQRNNKYQTIKNINWEQVEKDVYRLRVDLNYPQLWGYDVTVDDNLFTLRIKRPPKLAKSPLSPVAGLTIAVEAGHGGPRNLGARGLSGSEEKEVNLGTATNFVSLLEIAGATPVMVRKGDETISLQDRIQRAVDANADLYISIHANSAGSDQGYLRVEGVSTYYKYLPWQPLSKALLTRMEETGLYNWGNIGSFNYRPCLMTEMPSVLVELGFMSHPGDEELLVDPEFQKKMAEAIFKGLEDYLETQRE